MLLLTPFPLIPDSRCITLGDVDAEDVDASAGEGTDMDEPDEEDDAAISSSMSMSMSISNSALCGESGIAGAEFKLCSMVDDEGTVDPPAPPCEPRAPARLLLLALDRSMGW